jgi:hypothetical protein
MGVDAEPAGRSQRKYSPTMERLDERVLLSFFGSSYNQRVAYQVAFVKREEDRFVSELKGLELHSQATPAEYLALRDDARAISAAASSTAVDPRTAATTAVAVSIQLDRAPLDGWLDAPGWAQVVSKLSTNLNALNIPPALIDKTVSDVKAVAASAGVSYADYQTYSGDLEHYQDGQAGLPSGYASAGYSHFPNPNVYYTQHIRGFFRGWAAQKTADEAKLSADIKVIGSASPSGVPTLRRDTGLFESIASSVPSQSNADLATAFVGAFALGSPSAAQQAQLKAEFRTALGGSTTARVSGAADRLIVDSPQFFLASGSSPTNVGTLVEDTRVVVNDGGDSALNPFLVRIIRGPSGQ